MESKMALGIMVEREAPNASRTGIEMFCKLPKSDVDPCKLYPLSRTF